MSNSPIREQLHQQIDHLPDELVEQIADFTLFVMARCKSRRYTQFGSQLMADFNFKLCLEKMYV